MKKMPENAVYFNCINCDFKSCKQSNYDKHLLTPKHKNRTKWNILEQKNAKKIFMCKKCNKEYKARNSLWYHEKKCGFIYNGNKLNYIDNNNDNDNDNNDINNDNDNVDEDEKYMYQGINIKDKDALVLHLLKQNGELQNKIIKIASQVSITNNNSNNIHNTTNNIDNKTFNLNLFLNETCKEAMNISEFVSSIKVNLTDLENTGRQGYVDGISNIILKNLNNLEQNFRPIHCSDSKREVFYIKENNEWTKETDSKPILTKAIKVIANENIKQIKHWINKYPDCTDSDSKKNNTYLKIVSNSMNGLTEEEGNKNINKIISNIAKEATINKSVAV
jgi:hypothetical protein